MAILTFETYEAALEGFSPDGRVLRYAHLFSNRHGSLSGAEAGLQVLRLRDIGPEEAGPLADCLLKGAALSEFRSRCSPEDWQRLLDALPEPVGA